MKMHNTLHRMTGAFCVLLSCAVMQHAYGQQASPLTACASHTPPFVLFDKGVAASGFSYELLQSLSGQIGRKLQVSELPWARCLNEVKAGQIDIAIDAYEDAERRKTFLYSRPYHTLTPQIFYRAAAPIAKAPLNRAKDLDRYKGCGILEFTYEHYDLDAAKLDLGAADDQKMLLKLKAGHCDYAVEELEYIIGGRSSVANWPDESDLQSIRPSWARGPKVHFLIGKNHAKSQALLFDVDRSIASMEKSGQTPVLRKKYFNSAGKP